MFVEDITNIIWASTFREDFESSTMAAILWPNPYEEFLFIHIERICKFFSATIDGRDLIFGHKLHIGTPYRRKCFLTRQIPTSCLPKSGGIISEH
jgi:hypothetical protein